MAKYFASPVRRAARDAALSRSVCGHSRAPASCGEKSSSRLLHREAVAYAVRFADFDELERGGARARDVLAPPQRSSSQAHSNWCPGSTMRPSMPGAGFHSASKNSRSAPLTHR